MGTPYTAYVLDDASRRLLLETFPPKYGDVIAHHITHKFGAGESDVPPPPRDVRVIGYHDSGAIQVLAVAVEGQRKQATESEPRFYHITLSLDREQGVSPKDSNAVLRKIVAENGEAALANLRESIGITVTPRLLSHADKKPETSAKSRVVPPRP